MSGKWIHRYPKNHVCDLPVWHADDSDRWGDNSLWQCQCTRRWTWKLSSNAQLGTWKLDPDSDPGVDTSW